MLHPQSILVAFLVGAAFGGLSTALVYARYGRSPISGAGIGGIIGGLGAQLLMLPLEHCVFVIPEGEGIGTPYLIGIGVAIVSSLLFLFPYWIWVQKGREMFQPSEVDTRNARFGASALPYMFLVPTLIILVAFLYWPMYNIIRLSLKTSLLGLRERFVCTNNYTSLVSGIESGRYSQSFLMTFGITLAIVVVGMGVSLFIASLANQQIRGAGVYRTLLIWPYALSPVVTGIIFTSMFNPQVGLVNFGLFEVFGIRPQWFSNSGLAPWVVIAAGIWNNMGFNILFYIAGLQSVPGDLLEAASIDGANTAQRFWRIKFPLLSPYTFFLLITNVTYGFYGIFGAVDTLTQGGPRGKTEVLIYKLFTDAFEFQKTGSASAQSLILFLLVAGFTIIQFRFVDRRVTYGS